MRSEARLAYLLGEGADPAALTKNKRNALHVACRARQSKIVGYLCSVSLIISRVLISCLAVDFAVNWLFYVLMFRPFTHVSRRHSMI